jgi:hypothetical protein
MMGGVSKGSGIYPLLSNIAEFRNISKCGGF